MGLLDLVFTVAKANGLSGSLVAAVVEQESAWNPWAIRYEPAFYTLYVENQGLIETEARARAMSWGLMQIMGQTARELGYQGKYLSTLLSPSSGLNYGCKKLSRCLAHHPMSIADALLEYNGGGDANYPAAVLARVPSYEAGGKPPEAATITA